MLKRFVLEVLLVAAVLGLFSCTTSKTFLEPMQSGKFEPTWESLQQYECPKWFRDAKFGIWAHWGPQCEPERGDWYARLMYMEKAPNWAGDAFEYHRRTYGHPSKFGFKDVIHQWKAENWDPEKLMALYKRAGAQYFFALANHHDNFDNYDSKYQPWNSVDIGPKKDIIGLWAKAARKNGLRFGASVHSAHAWIWYEPTQGADKTGEFAGVPYDGNLTKADGKGQWWEGLEPQDLYAQNHPRSTDMDDPVAIDRQWNWDNGASIPDAAYCTNFYNRTIDLINKYQPDLIYFDDTVLPLYPISDVGLKIAAHYYNSSMKWHKGKNEAVIFGKILTPEQRQCLVWDVERGASNEIEPLPWQSCTCIGSWHYDRSIFERHSYKSAKTVIHMLVDIVSKNGNILLSIPVRGDGTIDSDEVKILGDIAAWMDINKESIFGTRPWKVLGEGPALADVAELKVQGFNEGKPFTAEDVRFTAKGDKLYIIVLGWPTKELQIKSLGKAAKLLDKSIEKITLLGSNEEIQWSQNDEALIIRPPQNKPCDIAVVFKIILIS
jgi:alpha-L-fucosidase